MLGHYLRATRLGYRQVPNRPFFMRLRPVDENHWAIDLHPLSLIPAEKGNRKQGKHVVWWETPEGKTDEGKELFALCPPLRAIKAIRQPVSFVIDGEGKVSS